MGRMLRGLVTGIGCLTVIGIGVVGVVIIVVAVSLSGGGGGGSGGGGAEDKPEKVVARISGTQGLKFSGNVGTLDEGRSVDGTVPAEYEVEDFDTGDLSTDSVSIVMQKNGTGGEMVCEIVVGGEVVKSSTTTADYGTCDVTWSPLD